MSNIELINPPEHRPYDESTIRAGLALNPANAGHGEAFSGRPVTTLFATPQHIIKLRTEYQLPIAQAKRFITQAITQEQTLGVHHPDKTWFLYIKKEKTLKEEHINENKANQQAVIGNITPKLQVLDSLDISLCSERSVDYLITIIKLYLDIAARHDRSLDLSLSNFGLGNNEAVYYLDDDVYPRNGFVTLADFLAKLLRCETGTQDQAIQRLGAAIRENVLLYFKDEHWVTVIAENLRSLFLPEKNEPLRKALIAALYCHRQFNYQPRNTATIIALLADIHSNAPALEAALNYLQKRNIESGLVLGDVVGYGPHPMQCISLLNNAPGLTVIRGNHDHAVVSGNTGNGITSLAGWAINWTMEQIDESAQQWLDALPPFVKTKQWLAVHGSPIDKTFFNAYVYPMTQSENLDNLMERNLHICFHGHTHLQKVYYRTKYQDYVSEAMQQRLNNSLGALVCPGSVGQPRGGMPGVELAIINLETLELEYHRIDYALESTIKDMQKFHFPSTLIERLQNGQ